MSKAKRVTKEDIYDAKIFPLMSQIIDICKQHKIAMIADFAVPNKSDPKLKCTTCLLDESHEPGDEQLEAMRALHPRQRNPAMITVTKADGSKEIHAIL